ncbi:hypothetical protein BS78_05G130700 [Paspalum vaginatum]|nr:hypothetical protein BS78_05G130700 [Paspalum vaginatum]
MLLTQLGTIDPLKGNNYPSWQKQIDMVLTLSDLDFTLWTNRPIEPIVGKAQYEQKMMQYSIDKRRWEISNNKCLMIIRHRINDSIEWSIPECTTTKELLERLKTQFTGSSKAYASTLEDDFTNMKCDSSGLNKYLGRNLPEDFVVHMIMKSLPKEYEMTFHVHYNTTVKDIWMIDQLMAQCLQEEERLKSHKSDSLNYTSHQSKKMNKNSKPNLWGLKGTLDSPLASPHHQLQPWQRGESRQALPYAY